MSHSHSHEGGACAHSHGAPAVTLKGAELDKAFQESADKVRKEMAVPENAAKYSTEDKTKIYSLYKQATSGDVQGTQPWVFEFEARTKWDGWAALKGMSQEAAKQNYVQFANEKISQ